MASGGSLTGKNLYKLDLSEIDLSGVDFRSADLRYVNFKMANLVGANLQRANLGAADLSQSCLSSADFSWADIPWGGFNNVTSISAIFRNCELLESVFCDATSDNSSFEGADPRRCKFNSVSLPKVNMLRANLALVDLRCAYIFETVFKGANTFRMST